MTIGAGIAAEIDDLYERCARDPELAEAFLALAERLEREHGK